MESGGGDGFDLSFDEEDCSPVPSLVKDMTTAIKYLSGILSMAMEYMEPKGKNEPKGKKELVDMMTIFIEMEDQALKEVPKMKQVLDHVWTVVLEKDCRGSLIECHLQDIFDLIYLLGHVSLPIHWRDCLINSANTLINHFLEKYESMSILDFSSVINPVVNSLSVIIFGSKKNFRKGISSQSLQVLESLCQRIFPDVSFQDLDTLDTCLIKYVARIPFLEMVKRCLNLWHRMYSNGKHHPLTTELVDVCKKTMADLKIRNESSRSHVCRTIPIFFLFLTDLSHSIQRLETLMVQHQQEEPLGSQELSQVIESLSQTSFIQ